MIKQRKSQLVAVHVGAGHHSADKTTCYKDVCKSACKKIVNGNQEDGLETILDALVVLENSPITNAGIGSNLTETGTVECDAGIMNGSNVRFGAVGAVRGIKNPSEAAATLLRGQDCGFLSGGRVPPSFLVGESAYAWAVKNDVVVVSQDALVTKSAVNARRKFYRKVFQAEPKRRCLEEVINVYDSSDVSDTVGAILVEDDGSIWCGASSGGLLLKQPGRVGPAAIMGTGFWAEKVSDTKKSLAACASGCGESLMRTFFAKSCVEAIKLADNPSLALEQFFQTHVIKSSLFSTQSERMVGILAVIYDMETRSGDVLWAHTTDSMCVGVASTSKHRTRMTKMSRLDSDRSSLVIEGLPFRL